MAHNKFLSYCVTSVITQLAVLLLAPDYGKKSITHDHEETDLNKGKYEMLLSRGAMITFVLTPLIILTDKYINQKVITHSKPLQYFLISGESVLPFLIPILSSKYSFLTGYDLVSGIVSSIFQSIMCKAILELDYQISETDIEDDFFTDDFYMNEDITNNPSLLLQLV